MTPEIEGCGDNSCVVAKPRGMATNGGCRCDERKLRRAVQLLRAALAERNKEWQEALMLWSGGSGLNTDDEFGEKLRALMQSKE
jgi:hypothetical protein